MADKEPSMDLYYEQLSSATLRDTQPSPFEQVPILSQEISLGVTLALLVNISQVFIILIKGLQMLKAQYAYIKLEQKKMPP